MPEPCYMFLFKMYFCIQQVIIFACSVDEVCVFLDLLTVSETAHDVVFDEGNGINSPTNLGLEATFINQNFSQQCLKRGPDKRVFSNPNPFVTDDDEGQVASVAYRYEDAQTNVSKSFM